MSRERFRTLMSPVQPARPTLPGRPAIAEDETMLPGGRAVPIDDLESSGMMSDALLRKARPEVYSAAHEGMSPGQVDIAARSQRPAADFLSAGAELHENEVELPGGRRAREDELEAVGGMDEALRRKGHPLGASIYSEMDPRDLARAYMRRMMDSTDRRVRDARRDRYDAAQVRRIRADEAAELPPFAKGEGDVVEYDMPSDADDNAEDAARADREAVQAQMDREDAAAAEAAQTDPERMAAIADRARVEAEARGNPINRLRRLIGR